MAKPRIDDYENVLMVEGYSDLLFVAEALEHLDRKAFIKEFNGKDDLKTKLELFLTPELLQSKRSFGLLVDADASPEGTSAAFSQVLKDITGQVVGQGAWTAGPPRMGLFVFPDALSTGELEDLVWLAWSADPRNADAKQCIESYLTCMATANRNAQSRAKALLGAFLAVCHDEDPRLGPGARARLFDFARPELAPFRAFLEGLG